MGSATKMTFEVRRLGKELLGIFTAEYAQSLSALYANQFLTPDTEYEVGIRHRIEDLAGVEKGDCEIQ